MILKNTEAIIQTSQGVSLPGVPFFSVVVMSDIVVVVWFVLSCNEASNVGDVVGMALTDNVNSEKKQGVNISVI